MGQHLLMWIKQCHEPPMTGNGLYDLYIYGDDWGMVNIVLPTLSPHVWGNIHTSIDQLF